MLALHRNQTFSSTDSLAGKLHDDRREAHLRDMKVLSRAPDGGEAGTGVYVLGLKELRNTVPKRGIMAHEAHKKAAEHHETAAKAHKTAAEHHEKGNHAEAESHSKKAHESSTEAHKHSVDAHSKSAAKSASKK